MLYWKNRIGFELRAMITNLKIRYRKMSREYEVDLPQCKSRQILKRHNLYYDKDGKPTWWFASFMGSRNTLDDLTKGILKYIHANISKDSKFLITGCGTGWMLFWLAQRGFIKLNGFDYLVNVVDAANDLADMAKIKVNIWQDDGFEPNLRLEKYDIVLALYWLYSAWMGNYGNKSHVNEDNQELLKQFISNYIPHMNSNGYFIVELIDSIADYNEPPSDVYPIRHSKEQVAECAEELGLSVEKMMFNASHGHLPRMVYVLKKKG